MWRYEYRTSKDYTFILINLNSLAPGRCLSNFESLFFEYMLRIKFMSTSDKIAFWWMPQNTFDDKSTLVNVMVWCRQAPLLEGLRNTGRSVCTFFASQWRHNDWVQWRLKSLVSRLIRRRSKKTSELRATDLCQENPPVTGGFPYGKAQ